MSGRSRLLTQNETGVALDTGEDLGLLDSPCADIREGLVANRRLLGSTRNSPARLGDLLLELLNEGRLDGGALMSADSDSKQRQTGRGAAARHRLVAGYARTEHAPPLPTLGRLAQFPKPPTHLKVDLCERGRCENERACTRSGKSVLWPHCDAGSCLLIVVGKRGSARRERRRTRESFDVKMRRMRWKETEMTTRRHYLTARRALSTWRPRWSEYPFYFPRPIRFRI